MLSLLVTPLMHPSKTTTVCKFNWGAGEVLTFKVNNFEERRTRKIEAHKGLALTSQTCLNQSNRMGNHHTTANKENHDESCSR